jgi:hypothetical protein
MYIRAGGRREGAKERAVVHSAAATAAAHSAVVAPAHDTPSPYSSSQVSGYTPQVDAVQMYPRSPRFERRPVRVGGATGQLWRQGISLECAPLGLVAGTCSTY